MTLENFHNVYFQLMKKVEHAVIVSGLVDPDRFQAYMTEVVKYKYTPRWFYNLINKFHREVSSEIAATSPTAIRVADEHLANNADLKYTLVSNNRTTELVTNVTLVEEQCKHQMVEQQVLNNMTKEETHSCQEPRLSSSTILTILMLMLLK